MTQDEIIEMADKADAEADKVLNMKGEFHPNWHEVRDEIFAKLVALRYQKKIADLENIICQRHWDVLQEREACAKVCDVLAVHPEYASEVTKLAAMAIRARGGDANTM
jgi:hypothetical protein